MDGWAGTHPIPGAVDSQMAARQGGWRSPAILLSTYAHALPRAPEALGFAEFARRPRAAPGVPAAGAAEAETANEAAGLFPGGRRQMKYIGAAGGSARSTWARLASRHRVSTLTRERSPATLVASAGHRKSGR